MFTGHIAHLAGRDGLVSGWLWLCWHPNGAARLTMGPGPDRGSAAEAFSFGAQMAGRSLHCCSLRADQLVHLKAAYTDQPVLSWAANSILRQMREVQSQGLWRQPVLSLL